MAACLNRDGYLGPLAVDPYNPPSAHKIILGIFSLYPSREDRYLNSRVVRMGAGLGFHNETTPRYDEKAAKLAWSRTLEFSKKYPSIKG